MTNNDFYKFATSNGCQGTAINDYMKFISSVQPTAGYVNPTITEERKFNVAQMDVFSRLMADRIIWLGTAIDDTVANIVNAQLLFLDSTDNEKDISLYLNTPGGEVYSGLSIYDTMHFIKSDVATICAGLAASMGSVLLAGGEKGKRSALKHSRVMIHQPLGGTKGQATEMEIAVEEIKKLKKELYECLANDSGQDLKRIAKDCDRDHFMTAQEALNYGMIDKIHI